MEKVKLFQVFVDNGHDYADHEEWVDLIASKSKEGALSITEERYKEQRNIVIKGAEELSEVDGYEVVLVKCRKKTE